MALTIDKTERDTPSPKIMAICASAIEGVLTTSELYHRMSENLTGHFSLQMCMGLGIPMGMGVPW